jgi:prepilin-type N-terminal cleavage/methylation domain-containing protein
MQMRTQRGFSLVEILAAFAILTLVITISLTAFLERNRRLQQAGEIVLAYQALANEAEYQRRRDYVDLTLEPTKFKSSTDILQPLKPFMTVVAVKPSRLGVKNVLMTIRWQNGERQARLELVRVDTGGTNLW